ncbi:helix-turn-helix domain-containing protein [Tessaracoccus sp. Y1736]
MSTRNASAPTPRAGARRWASLNEAAEYIRVHPKTLTRRFSDGSLIRYRVGRGVMVDLDELDELVVASAGGLKTLAG